MVEKGRITGMDKIEVRDGREINKYMKANHLTLVIDEARFGYG